MKEYESKKATIDMIIFFSWALLLLSPFLGYFIALSFMKIFQTEHASPALLIISIIVLFTFSLSIIISYRHKREELALKFRKDIIKPKVEEMFPGVEYYPEKGLPDKEFLDSKLVELGLTFKVYSSSDLMIGQVKGVHFKSCDVEVKPAGKTNRSSLKKDFCGRFYVFDFCKEFKSNLILLQPGQRKPLLYQEYKEIDYESYDFNIEYTIYSNDSHEAFYIITPHLIEKLMTLDNMFEDQISFSFNNSKLYIAINKGQRLLDVNVLTEFNQYRVNYMLENLSEMDDLIDSLNLDNTLFKRK